VRNCFFFFFPKQLTPPPCTSFLKARKRPEFHFPFTIAEVRYEPISFLHFQLPICSDEDRPETGSPVSSTFFDTPVFRTYFSSYSTIVLNSFPPLWRFDSHQNISPPSFTNLSRLFFPSSFRSNLPQAVCISCKTIRFVLRRLPRFVNGP